ncbi:MAG: PTS sugar transporter subunit IIA [Sedimentisphaerales bacterium]|nr:PTS sugar transporter subunit IIA [Sedimentisphaerales bacterium]
MNLCEFMVPEAFVPHLEGTKRDDIIRELVNGLAQAGAIKTENIEDIILRLIDREKQGSTGIGKGIAVPHIKHPSVARIVGTIGCSRAGVDFASLDKAPVFSVLLLLSPPDNPDRHLEAMESLFGHLQRDMFRKFLRQADSRETLVDLIQEADESNSSPRKK